MVKPVRRNIGAQQDVTVLKVLRVRSGLEMFLQGVAAFIGGSAQRSFINRHSGKMIEKECKPEWK